MNNKTLKEILQKNSDWNLIPPNQIGTDKDTIHNYVDGFYENAFAQYRDKKVTILEIGAWTGHSLLLWDEYFNQKKIYSVDVYDRLDPQVKNSKNIVTAIDNAYTKEVADNLPNFDIVIDDGPHTLESMLQCIDLYLNKINPGGMLIIEDIQSFDWIPLLKARIPDKYLSSIEVIDLRQTKNRYDDILFVVRLPL